MTAIVMAMLRFYRFLSLLNHTSPANTRKQRGSLLSRTQVIVLVPPLDRD